MIARALACWALAAALVVPPLAAAQEPRASLPDIEDEVMCPICGTTLELSEAPQAERERALIRSLVDQGLTKDEIKDRLVVEYGPEVLSTPESSGFDLMAWLVPALTIAALALALVVFVRRPSSKQRTPAPLESADAARLRDDISHYD